MLKFVVLVITIQLFYGFGITLLAYGLPTEQITLVETYQQPSQNLNVSQISETIEESIQTQLDIPVVDVGVLVFYSGNIVIDMLINFFTAVPSMITIAASSFFMLFPIDAFIATQIKLVLWVFIAILYFVAFLSFILQIRSGTGGSII